MTSEETQLSLMTYFFESSVNNDFYNKLDETLNDVTFQGEQINSPMSDDELVQIGVKLIDDYLELCNDSSS